MESGLKNTCPFPSTLKYKHLRYLQLPVLVCYTKTVLELTFILSGQQLFVEILFLSKWTKGGASCVNSLFSNNGVYYRPPISIIASIFHFVISDGFTNIQTIIKELNCSRFFYYFFRSILTIYIFKKIVTKMPSSI